MANGNNALTTVTGTVERTNDTGILLDGGRWINFSNYGVRKPTEGGPPAPQPGTVITAQLKNEKFIQTLTIGGMVPTATPQPVQAQQTATTPTTAPVVVNAPGVINVTLIAIETRQTLLKTLAVAQPQLFADLEKLELLTEIVRNLETFVLEDLAPKPEEEPELEDLLDEDSGI